MSEHEERLRESIGRLEAREPQTFTDSEREILLGALSEALHQSRHACPMSTPPCATCRDWGDHLAREAADAIERIVEARVAARRRRDLTGAVTEAFEATRPTRPERP